MLHGLHESIAAIRSSQQPTTIDAVTALNGEEGLHSILDCPRVADLPQFGTVSPMSNDDTMALFGSPKPHADAIRAAERELLDLESFERWEGRFLFGYSENGEPLATFFFGFSGD